MPAIRQGQITNQVGNKTIGATAETLVLGGALTILEVLEGVVWFQATGGVATVDGADCTKLAAGDGQELRDPKISIISDATTAKIQYVQYGDQV